MVTAPNNPAEFQVVISNEASFLSRFVGPRRRSFIFNYPFIYIRSFIFVHSYSYSFIHIHSFIFIHSFTFIHIFIFIHSFLPQIRCSKCQACYFEKGESSKQICRAGGDDIVVQGNFPCQFCGISFQQEHVSNKHQAGKLVEESFQSDLSS